MLSYNTTLFYKLVMVCTLLRVPYQGNAQPVVTIPSSAGCIGHDLLIPLYVEEFYDIESFTIKMISDITKVEFVGITNPNAALENGILVDNTIIDDSVVKINVVWVGNQPVHLNNETLFFLKLSVKESNAEILFEEQELVLSDYTVVEDAVFNHGNIIQWNNLDPEVSDTNPEIGEAITMELPDLYALNYQWQINEDEEWIDLEQNQWFENTQEHQLKISEVSEDLNNKKFRCHLMVGECTEVSKTIAFSVQTVGLPDWEQQQIKDYSFKCYPNPVKQILNCYCKKEYEDVTLKLVDISGNLVKKMFFKSIIAGETIEIPVEELRRGLYVLKLYEHEIGIGSKKFIKR